MREIEELEQIIGYKFKNIKLLERATLHRSYANQNGIESNERLEFLGDSVLEYIMTDYLYKNMPHSQEGVLTKIRSYIVCEDSLYSVAELLDIVRFVKISKAQEKSSGKSKPISADMVEAIIAAIALDGGLENAQKFVMKNFKKIIQYATKTNNIQDYKTTFQELAQKNGVVDIRYVLEGESGPDHEKHFIFSLNVNGKMVSVGQGNSKKEAQMDAAKKALEVYEDEKNI